jgi:hypothetical protein
MVKRCWVGNLAAIIPFEMLGSMKPSSLTVGEVIDGIRQQVENRRGQYGSSDEIPYQLWAASFSFKATALQAYVEAKSGPFSHQNGQPLP